MCVCHSAFGQDFLDVFANHKLKRPGYEFLWDKNCLLFTVWCQNSCVIILQFSHKWKLSFVFNRPEESAHTRLKCSCIPCHWILLYLCTENLAWSCSQPNSQCHFKLWPRAMTIKLNPLCRGSEFNSINKDFRITWSQALKLWCKVPLN